MGGLVVILGLPIALLFPLVQLLGPVLGIVAMIAAILNAMILAIVIRLRLSSAQPGVRVLWAVLIAIMGTATLATEALAVLSFVTLIFLYPSPVIWLACVIIATVCAIVLFIPARRMVRAEDAQLRSRGAILLSVTIVTSVGFASVAVLAFAIVANR